MTTIITYATATAALAHPIEAVWAPIALFGGLEDWVAGVSACTLDGEGVGAVRTVVCEGREVRERLEVLDPAAHLLRYQILAPHSLPAEGVHGTIELRALDARNTEIVWRSDAVNFTREPGLLGERIEAFYRASIEGLRRLLERGEGVSG